MVKKIRTDFDNNIIANSVEVAWMKMADAVLEFGEKVSGTRELNNVKVLIQSPEKNLLRSRHNFSLPYYLGEMIWYGAGANDVRFISKFGKIWEKLSDDGITNESAYGYILKQKHGFNQIIKMVELLKKDPHSRRAVMNINVPRKNVIETNDEQCTIALQVLLRDGKLNMTGIMRSNDLWTGTPYDLFYFTEIQKYIANKLGVEVGTYTHFVSSLHIYDRNIDDVKKSIHNFWKSEKKKDVHIDGQALLAAAPTLYWELSNCDPKEAKKKVVELCLENNIVWGEDVL